MDEPVAIEDLIPEAQEIIVSADAALCAGAGARSRAWWRVGVADDGSTYLY
jgi:hypothetical protein